MFMFRSKRTILTKQLVRARKRRSDDEARRAVEDDTKELMSLLKKLKDNQLEMLFTAVESHGKDLSNCVLMPRDKEPHVLCCQTWRWPDVKLKNSDLRRLPACRSASDTVYICCNPYHWSLLYKAESPPPPYSFCTMDRLKPEDRAPSEAPLVFRDYPGSLTTNGEDSSSSPDLWCTVAYWELANRVGPLFSVEVPFVNIFWDIPYIPYGSGLSIKGLAHHSFSPPEEVRRVRCKIGLGITLSREDGSVWVYNRSAYPIFVNSLTLEEDEGNSSPTRVPAEHCLCVFDPVKAAHKICARNTRNQFGPVDHNSVIISFAKGWGSSRYTRREITSCPCRIEILLVPCR